MGDLEATRLSVSSDVGEDAPADRCGVDRVDGDRMLKFRARELRTYPAPAASSGAADGRAATVAVLPSAFDRLTLLDAQIGAADRQHKWARCREVGMSMAIPGSIIRPVVAGSDANRNTHQGGLLERVIDAVQRAVRPPVRFLEVAPTD